MNLPLFLSRRIYGGKVETDADDKPIRQKSVSRPAIRIATIGVAIGLAVMIVTVSVVIGFKHTIRDKVAGFGSHIQVENIMSFNTASDFPICINDSMLQLLETIPGIKHAERYAITQGILKTDEDFLGVALKGIGQEYDLSFIQENLVEGELPQFCDSSTKYPLVISKTIAQKLRLKIDDRIFAYFISDEGVKARRFTVKAIYQTNMKRFDDSFCLTDIYATNKLNGWFTDQCSGAELIVDDFDHLETASHNVVKKVNRTLDAYNNTFSSRTITDAYPQIFSWLELLDINVWIILGLMIVLAGFTMTSGLLIIILERTQMIGILKALGARDSMIRKTFLWFSVFIISRGLLWGNIIGIGLVILQQTTGIVTLDPQTYYVSEAPMELNLFYVLLLNIATLFISIFVLIAPSYLVAKIHPARSMRYE
ncbi:FtsX-like permease family protein [Prevotella sp. E9-3]|uniref:ABC transporter permease n=1 Tax=Prevotella sp. E9-3 TaxID=2913621 RepID=UPI001EDA5ADC|nr:FtsX-like permease family protein [Prevotella sp. E9-3]UKK47020.1 FtsX-like permease family protein [Prevotella sp. E9-3]